MEIKEIRKFHDDKTYIDENGNKVTLKELTTNKFRDEKMTIQILKKVFDENYTNLTFEQIELLRDEHHKKNKTKGYDKNKVNIFYEDGFAMIPKGKEIQDIKRSMPYDIRGILDELSMSTNKNGIIVNDGNYAIRTISELCEYLKISRKIWNNFKQYNEKYNILKKEKINNKWYLVLSPIFSSTQYELDFYRFMTFGDILFDNGYIDEYDFA